MCLKPLEVGEKKAVLECKQITSPLQNTLYKIIDDSFFSGNDHLLVKISRWIEEFVGRRVSQAFCVSHAMRKDLDKTLGILSDGVTVLYDRPGESFRPCTDKESSQLFTKLSRSYPELTPISENGKSPEPTQK